MELTTPGGMTAGGTVLFIAQVNKTSLLEITKLARFIPVANKFYALGSVSIDLYRAGQAYAACTKAGN
jgi:hypothetical protein